MSSTLLRPGRALLAALGLLAGLGCGGSGSPRPGTETGAEPAAAPPPVPASGPDGSPAAAADSLPPALLARAKGSPAAPITVFELSDFQCPFCRRFAEQTFPTLEREYVATGKVRWVFINFPLTSIHPNAVPAAEFALCAADQGRFWPAHDLLYRHQDAWAGLENPAPFLLGLADSLRLSRDSVVACLENPATGQRVEADARSAARAGASSTPTFYLAGGLLVGAQPVEVWRPILDSIYAAKTAPGAGG